MEEAHYRLAQVYRQTGEKLQAEKEMQFLEQMAKESAGEGDRERRAMQQFVYTVRGQNLDFQHPE